jgi:hypothetical protein
VQVVKTIAVMRIFADQLIAVAPAASLIELRE